MPPPLIYLLLFTPSPICPSVLLQPSLSFLCPAPSPPPLYTSILISPPLVSLSLSLLTFLNFPLGFFLFRRCSQHLSSVRPPRPHHHRGHAGQQRHRPSAEHVPGALPVTAAGPLPGGRVGGALGARRGCFHLQHPAGRSAGRNSQRELLGRVARRTLLPLGGPGRTAVPEQAEADVADADGGRFTRTNMKTNIRIASAECMYASSFEIYVENLNSFVI